MGIDPSEMLVGDLVVKIHHRRFNTQAQIWFKLCNGAKEWNIVTQFQSRFFSTSYLP